MVAEKVKMTVADIRQEYTRLSELVREKKLFASEVNLAIAKNNIALEAQVKLFNENIDNLVERYAAKDASGKPQVKNNMYVFEVAEDEKAYRQAVGELEKTEVEMEIQKVLSSTLSDEKHDEPTAQDIVALLFMLKD